MNYLKRFYRESIFPGNNCFLFNFSSSFDLRLRRQVGSNSIDSSRPNFQLRWLRTKDNRDTVLWKIHECITGKGLSLFCSLCPFCFHARRPRNARREPKVRSGERSDYFLVDCFVNCDGLWCIVISGRFFSCLIERLSMTWLGKPTVRRCERDQE